MARGNGVAIPYLIERSGSFYWQPKGACRKAGFEPKPLGKDRARAEGEALRLYQQWKLVEAGDADAGRYSPGTVGDAWQRIVRTTEWAALSDKTRLEYHNNWKHRIEPAFGVMKPDTIDLIDHVEPWRDGLLRKYPLSVVHSTIKNWRSLWNKMAALKYCQRNADPSLGLRNKAPKPRKERFFHEEAIALTRRALYAKRPGLACVIALCWDTMFQPGDVRRVLRRHLVEDQDGRLIIDLSIEGRGKTGVPVIGTMSARTERMVRAYVARMNAMPDAPVFRRPNGQPYSKDYELSDDFAAVRELAFPGDRRQLRDMRRSGAMEASADPLLDKKALADKMGNSIDRSDLLQRTYTPVDLENVRRADAARERARAMRKKG